MNATELEVLIEKDSDEYLIALQVAGVDTDGAININVVVEVSESSSQSHDKNTKSRAREARLAFKKECDGQAFGRGKSNDINSLSFTFANIDLSWHPRAHYRK